MIGRSSGLIVSSGRSNSTSAYLDLSSAYSISSCINICVKGLVLGFLGFRDSNHQFCLAMLVIIKLCQSRCIDCVFRFQPYYFPLLVIYYYEDGLDSCYSLYFTLPSLFQTY